jgi:hypothetical protein
VIIHWNGLKNINIMANIEKIYDDAEMTNQVYPQTHERAVVDNNGTTAETKFQMITELVNQKQMEIGAVPSDLTPTEGSTNWVISGGLFPTLYENVESPQIDTLSTDMGGNLVYGSSHTYETSSTRVIILSSPLPDNCVSVSVASVYEFAVAYVNVDESIVTPYNGLAVTLYGDTGYLTPKIKTVEKPNEEVNRVHVQMKVSSISDAVNGTSITFNIKDTINKVTTLEESCKEITPIDISALDEISSWINDSAAKWATSDNAHCLLVPCLPNKKYMIEPPSGKMARYAFLKDSTHSTNTYPSFCNGYYGCIDIDEVRTISTPSDANYIYILKTVQEGRYDTLPNLYHVGSKIRDFDQTPTKKSENGITSGGVYDALLPIAYYGVSRVNVLNDITADMWAATTWNGTTFSTSNTGSTILLPNDISQVIVGDIQIALSGSQFAVGTLLLDDEEATNLYNNIPVVSLASNSGYVSAGSYTFDYPSEKRQRVYIQIKSSAGSASSDIAMLTSVIMSLPKETEPLNAAMLSKLDNMDLSAINPYMKTFPYFGEPINLRQFAVRSVASGLGTQGSCCYNGVIFGFSSNSLTVKIFDMNTGVLKTATMESGDSGSPSNSHNNAAFFTDEFYDANDPFPLIGTSDSVNKIARIFRIGVNNGTYSLTLVQKITFAQGDSAHAVGNTYTYGEGKIWALSEIVSNGTRTWYLYDFNMPSLSQGDVTLTDSSSNEHVLVNPYNYQGMCYYGGMLYMPQKTSASDIIVFDPTTNTVVTTLPIAKAVSKEIEDTWIYKNRLYFTSNDGLAFVVYTY